MQQDSYRLNQDLALSSCRGSGKTIPPPFEVAISIFLGFGTNVELTLSRATRLQFNSKKLDHVQIHVRYMENYYSCIAKPYQYM